MGSKRSNNGPDRDEYDDDYDDETNEKSEKYTNGFQRADDTELRQRRIVRAKSTSTNESSSRLSNNNSSNSTGMNQNPFSNIQLLPSSSSSKTSSTRFSLAELTSEPINHTAAPATFSNSQQQSIKTNTVKSSYETILAARNRLDQQFMETMLKQQQLYPHKPWTNAIRYYLASQRVLDQEWNKLNPSSKATSSNSSSSSSTKNHEKSTARLAPPAVATPMATNPFTAASTTATTTNNNNNMFGSFAPTPAPQKNPFEFTAATAPVSSSTNDNGSNDDNTDEVVEETNIRRATEPEWTDIGEYENVRFFKQNDIGAWAKFCLGTLRLQRHKSTSEANFSRMILRNLNGSEVIVNIRIDRDMKFDWTRFEQKQQPMGKIVFKAINSIQLGPETFAMAAKVNEAQKLYTQLLDIASK